MTERAAPRILIVDDERRHMEALCELLETRGYKPSGFAAPDLALATVEPGRYEVLLTDLMMPGMNGIALLDAARQKDPDLAPIIMTGEGTVATAVEAMKSGALDYILKPFKLNAVLPVLERALAARALRQENAALQRRVLERTAELEEANRELEAFSYSVSHDLRAPLRHIDGFASLLVESCAAEMPTESRRLLDVVCKESKRMGRLIDDLLRFSRLARQPMVKEPVNTRDLFNEALVELQSEHADRNVDVRLGEMPDCKGDRALLRQVAVNLLSNAFKFTRKREKAVVEIGGRAEQHERVYYVKDNGAGFDMQYAQRLFGVFQRLHSADEFEGTGVGLSIVHRIIVRHGGRIWAEAWPEKGAVFHFALPE